MNYAVTMHFGGTALRSALRPALLGAALAWGAQALPAGEPIRFSGRTGPAAWQQDFDRREPLLPAEARSGARPLSRPDLSVDAFAIPSQAVTPTIGLTRRQREAQDQQRNWIFQPPDAILKRATERDDLQARNPRDETEPSKSSVERFLDKPEGKSDSPDKARNGDSGQKQVRDQQGNAGNSQRRPDESRGDPARSEATTTGLETRPSGGGRGGDDRSLFNFGEARSGGLGRALDEAKDRERQAERNASIAAFRRTLGNPWAQPAGGGTELARSGTGAALMPGGGLLGAGPERRGTVGPPGQPGRATTDLSPRGGLGGFDPKNPLNYGTPESVLKQNDAPRAAPRPIVLEIPKRKF